MQNRYVGDVGDFGKYGLLKALCAPAQDDQHPALSLGVVWYLVPDETHNDDGRHIRYLKVPGKTLNVYGTCDMELYTKLQWIVEERVRRKVGTIRELGILPAGTTFYEKFLTFDGMPGIGPYAVAARLAHRSQWVQGAHKATNGSDLIFVDPDNGLEIPSTKHHHIEGPKYAFLDEVSPYFDRGQSLVIYHHISRKETAENQVWSRLFQLMEHLGCENPFALLYHRGTSRSFLVVPASNHGEPLLERAGRFVHVPWSRHFELIR